MKLTTLLFFTALLVSFLSCNSNNISLQPVESTILDTSKLSSDSSNLQVNRIDTIKYSNLPYWDSTFDRFRSAYIDTFSVDGNRFRFINPFADKEQLDIIVYLEKFVNANWVFTGFTVGTMNHIGDYHHSRDVNGDGFIDITQDEQFVQAVYFYDPVKGTYPGTTEPHDPETNFISPVWELIDTARKIFCDFQELKLMCGQIHSLLYTYKGTIRQNLYDLELYNCDNFSKVKDYSPITKLIIKQGRSKKVL